ncbi:hypothetical protein AB0L65_58145 [Nonomuraea sp. NPDC052116]|uniref:hypothetical protein n=1 Tax=Nonomuraea sp. NPDC052116 TaxID=3155665 RepID=UPI003434583B
MNPAALRGAEPVVWDCPIFDLEEPVPEFDASRSVFEFDKAGLPPEFAADLAAACFAGRLVLGGDLAPLLAHFAVPASRRNPKKAVAARARGHIRSPP